MPTVEQTLSCARSQLGYAEPGRGDRPGTQVTKYGIWYASWSHQPAYKDTYWCAMFQSWTLSVAGFTPQAAGRFGNCNPWIAWLKSKGMWSRTPIPGALVFFDWTGDGRAEHIGMVESVRGDGRVVTLEGNASVPGRNDGVYRLVRKGGIVGYGHLPYSKPAKPAPKQAAVFRPVSKSMGGPVKIIGEPVNLCTADARLRNWSACPMMARGFGGPENVAQKAWVAYWYALMARFSPGYFKQVTSSSAGKNEVARREIGPATIQITEMMLRQAGKVKGSTHGVIPTVAWSLYQP